MRMNLYLFNALLGSPRVFRDWLETAPPESMVGSRYHDIHDGPVCNFLKVHLAINGGVQVDCKSVHLPGLRWEAPEWILRFNAAVARQSPKWNSPITARECLDILESFEEEGYP